METNAQTEARINAAVRNENSQVEEPLFPEYDPAAPCDVCGLLEYSCRCSGPYGDGYA